LKRIHEFNEAPGRPLVNLAYANGFLPETYAFALQPLFAGYRVVSTHVRAMWGGCRPESLTHWSQLGDDLLDLLGSLADQPVVGIGHSFGGVATLYAALKRPERFSRLILIDPTLLPPRYLLPIRLVRLLGRDHQLPLVQGALRRRREWESPEAAFESFRKKALFRRGTDILRAYIESIRPVEEHAAPDHSPEWTAYLSIVIQGLAALVGSTMLVILATLILSWSPARRFSPGSIQARAL
jgi:pimeloyl-ACP methyl ester carboxylesterase